MSEPASLEARRRAALKLHLSSLSPRRRTALVRAAGGLLPAARLDRAGLLAHGLPGEAAEALSRIGEAELDAELAACERVGARLVLRGDGCWPEGLEELADPPEVLWVRGNLPEASRDVPVTLVGPRRASPLGLALATRFSRELSELGATIVSGGARGVDGAAHEAALDAGGRTVAVLGCGVDVAYPPEHRALFERIASCGALVSESACGSRPLRHRFPVRNRLLAGWSAVVVIPEASLRSGTLVTARLAVESGREVCAVPGSITSKLSEGTNELLARGARVTRGTADVVAELPEAQRARLVDGARRDLARATAGPLDPVLEALPEGRVEGLDALALLTGLGCGDLLARLVRLEASGCIRALPGGSWLGLGRVGRGPAPPLASGLREEPR